MADVFDSLPSQGDVFDQITPQESQHPYLATAARIAPAVIGGVVGGVPGAVFGGGMGELLGQLVEGGDINKKQIALNALLGAIPGFKAAGVTSTLGRMGVRAAEGAALGGLGTAASSMIEGQTPDLGNVGQNMLLGGVLGGGAGALEARYANKLPGVTEPNITEAKPKGDVFDQIKPAPRNIEQQIELPIATAAEDLSPQLKMQKRVEQLMAENAAMEAENKRKDAFVKAKPGYEPRLFDEPKPQERPDFEAQLRQSQAEPDPIMGPRPPLVLTERQIARLNMYQRTNPEEGLRYYNNIVNKYNEVTPTRSVEVGANVLGVPTERGKLAQAFDVLTSDPLLPDKPTKIGLFLRKFGQNSSDMVAGFGPGGQQLVRMVKQVYDGFETDMARFLDGDNGILHMANTMKLTPAERENISNTLEGFATPMNERVQLIVQQARPLLDEVGQRGKALLGIDLRDNYFPHFVNFDEVVKDRGRLDKILSEIQTQEGARQGHPITTLEAQDIFNNLRRNSRQEYGNLEMARQFNFSDYEKDGIKALGQYFEGSLKRLHEAAVYGPKSERVVNAIRAVSATADDDAAYAAQRYMTQIMGRDPMTGLKAADNNQSSILNYIRHFEIVSKLSHAVIGNASQSNMTALITGYGNLAKGFMALQTEAGKDFGRLAGAAIEHTMRDIEEAVGPGKLGGAVLKYTGFDKVEMFNRMLAANAGRVFAQDLADKLATGVTGKAADTFKRHLRAMGIEPAELAARGFKLTPEEELKAGRSVIERSQFKVRAQDLPLYWNGPLGKFASQFSSFGFKAAKAIKDEVLTEAKNGNYAPLARFMLVTPLIGEGFSDIQTLVKGKSMDDRPENILLRAADNAASIGAFGLFWDAFRAGGYGELGLLRRLVGPGASDIIQAGAHILQGDPQALAQQAMYNVPVVGPAIGHNLFKKEKP